MINAEKYARNVTLLCPTCGGDQFEHREDVEAMKCAGCGRELTKDELIHENGENIAEHTKEIGKEFAKDVEKELRDSFRKALQGSKHIKIK